MILDELARRGLQNRCVAGIECSFLIVYWWNTARSWAGRCGGNLPAGVLRQMRQEIKRTFPNFRRNKYYKQHFSKRARLLTALMMISPLLYRGANTVFLWSAKARRAIVNRLRAYPKCYVSLRSVRRRVSNRVAG